MDGDDVVTGSAHSTEGVAPVAASYDTVGVLLEQEAAALRRSRRLHRRLLLGYVALGLSFGAYELCHLPTPLDAPFADSQLVLAQPIPVRVPDAEPASVLSSGPAAPPHIRGRLGDLTEAPVELLPPAEAQVQPPAPPLTEARSEFHPGLVAAVLAITALVLTGTLRALRGQKRAAGALAALDDVRAVGPLAEALAVDDARVRRSVAAAQTRLLPRLRASDAGLLTPRHHAVLNGTLTGRDEPLALTVLSAWEQVGDMCDLGIVERIAAGEAAASSAVVDAAAACLPALRQRCAIGRVSRRLLRPAAASDAAMALLRPAGADASPAEALLRATTQDDAAA